MNIEQQVINLLLDDVVKFHEELTNKYTMENGIHDMNMLESAINTPFQSFAGVDLYPSIFDKASRLCFGLAKNHPFNDGNKRTAVHTMLVYLFINNILLSYDKLELEQVIIDVASGVMNVQELSKWIENHVSKS